MLENISISLKNVMIALHLNAVFMPKNPNRILIFDKSISRLGLELTGCCEYFDNKKILVIGQTENSYLETLSSNEKFKILDNILVLKPPAIVVTKDVEPCYELVSAAEKNLVPVLKSVENTSKFISNIIEFLSIKLAPRVTQHGVLVEVYGQGIFLTGESGIGKSETAVELIQRGHRLVADDAVQIKRINDKTLRGSAPKNLRHFIELRGIGIINARRLFGMGAIKTTKEIDLVVNLELWNSSKIYDRVGIDDEFTKILDVEIPIINVPIRPGRNIATIIEVAAMNNRQKKMGYNAARELLDCLGMEYSEDDKPKENNIILDDE